MMSVQMEIARAVAKRYSERLRSTDARLSSCVRIIHEEGTTYFFESAFLMRWKDSEGVIGRPGGKTHFFEWLFVFTEHQGFMCFPLMSYTVTISTLR